MAGGGVISWDQDETGRRVFPNRPFDPNVSAGTLLQVRTSCAVTSDSAALTCTSLPRAFPTHTPTDISGVGRRCSARHLLWLQTAGDRPRRCGCHGKEEHV